MTSLAVVVLVPVFGVASWWMADRMRRFAIARAMLDVPNARSSHSVPTPRGGGVAIALTVLPALAIGWLAGWMPTIVTGALVGGGVLVAGVGWVDDRHGLSSSKRAAAHCVAAVCLVAALGGLAGLRVGDRYVTLGGVGSVLAVLWIVWSVNLYNFMDGIDGIAGIEALSVGTVGGALSLATGQRGLGFAALAIAAASLGFLVLNWHPARLFMGDVGSGLLGYLFGGMAVVSERLLGVPLVVWLILLSVFIVDATLTLLRRLIRGDKWYEGHRLHAYQRLAHGQWSHARVSSGVLAVNVVLGALAVVAQCVPGLAPACLAGAALVSTLAYLAIEGVAPMYRSSR